MTFHKFAKLYVACEKECMRISKIDMDSKSIYIKNIWKFNHIPLWRAQQIFEDELFEYIFKHCVEHFHKTNLRPYIF